MVFHSKSEAQGGSEPFSAVFSPVGDKIAVGFDDSTNVNVLDGHDLAFLCLIRLVLIMVVYLASLGHRMGIACMQGEATIMVQI